MIPRILLPKLSDHLFKGKAILLYGPRQVGKTTLLYKLLDGLHYPSLRLNADDPTVRKVLDLPNIEQLRQLIGKHTIILIDEAQRVSQIGLTAKLITDTFKDVQLLLSGSSSFELASVTQESLTGRKRTFFLYPISWKEWQDYAGFLKAEQDLENRLVFGMYPDVLNQTYEQEVVLRELADSYLFKDILQYGNLKKPDEIRKLLQALAFQVGNEVSYQELSQIAGLDPKTVERYIHILEQAFIVFKLGSFNRNLRNEIKAGKKIYFYDNGIRNAVIGQLQHFALRTDKGALWENFIISERKKQNHYDQKFVNEYFWRTTQQQEIDYLEEHNGVISAFEIKLNPRKKPKTPVTFQKAYQSEVSVINRENFRDFIM